MENVIRLHPDDNVATASRAIPAGAPIVGAGRGLTAAGEIPYGHKVALVEIAQGGRIVKYGEAIGAATARIAPGELVHSHNLGALEP